MFDEIVARSRRRRRLATALAVSSASCSCGQRRSRRAPPSRTILRARAIVADEIVDAFETDEENLFSIVLAVSATLGSPSRPTSLARSGSPDERADVDLERAAETLFQGMTMGRPVVVNYRADFNPETREVGELEKVGAADGP